MKTEILISLGIALVVVSAVIGIYYAVTGIPPGASMTVSTPPMSSNEVPEDQAKFMFFYTTWCPWSKKAQQPWASLKQFLKESPKTYGGKTVILEEINADADAGKTALYKVEAYPTFKLETQDKVYQMLGNPSMATFRAFLASALGDESS